MDIDTSKLYAVLTGDVIGSSKLSKRSRRSLYTVMRRGSEALRSLFGDIIPLEVDIFRGDSWQMLLSAPERSFRIGLLYRLYLKTSMQDRTDTRFGVGIGPVSFIPGERVSEGEGEAFRLSGQALEEMGSFCSLGFRTPAPEGFRSQWLDATAVLLDAIVLNWTEKQALAIYGALLGWTQKRIGSLWSPPISQQTVAEYLKNARWHHIDRFLDFFENADHILTRNDTGQ